ncbi:MAG: hypothetical protein JWN35_963 [Frankiales bacterium]|jgi:hypothetical protein|nr:hypothetical protein [Frankiales bacterium]
MHAITLVEAFGVLILLIAVPLLALAVRRRLLQRGGGTVDLSLRLKSGRHGRGWVLGVGRFHGDALEWYRVFSLAPRPRRTLTRRDLSVVVQREPIGAERLALLSGAVVMECRNSKGKVELAMELSAATGFLAWLEATPPGATLPSRSV